MPFSVLEFLVQGMGNSEEFPKDHYTSSCLSLALPLHIFAQIEDAYHMQGEFESLNQFVQSSAKVRWEKTKQ